MSKASILIVEDEHIIALDIQNNLERNGYQVVERADRGEIAINKAEELLPNLILMDISLKGEMDGIEAADQIQARFDIPVVFLTSFSNQSIVERAIQTDSFGYILKPFEERELIITIEMALYKHRMERKLRESENRFRSVIEHASDGIALLDRDGKLIQWNPAMEDILGLESSEVIGQPIWDVTFQVLPREKKTAAFLEMVSLQWQAAIKNDYSNHDNMTEREIETPQGIRKTVQSNAFTLHTSQGILGGVIMRDITERKQTENIIHARLRLVEIAVRHSLQELLTKTLDEVCAITNSPIGFYHFVEPDQTTLSLQAWSTRTLQEYCQAEGEELHLNVTEAGIWADCIRQRQPVIHNDYAALPALLRRGLPEGHAQLIRELVVPILRDGLIVAILGVGNKTQDYTQGDVDLAVNFADIAWELIRRKRAETELLKLTQAVEQSANAIVMTDIDGNIEYANPKFTQMSGYSLAEASGKNPRILRSGEHDLAFYQNLWKTIKNGGVWKGEFHNRHKDGRLYWEDTTIAPVYDPAGKMINFIAVKEDITARKALEADERDQRLLVEALRDTAMALNSTLKLDDILDRILGNIGKFVKYDVAMVSLIEGNLVRKIRYHSNPEHEFNRLQLRDVQANLVNVPILREIIETRRPYLIPDIQKDDRWQTVAAPGIQHIRALACIPIESQGNILGVITIISATPGFFTPLHIERIVAFASQAAVAIENARLFERTQRLALTDSLTGLYNMRYFDEFASLEFERTNRNKRTLCIAMVDIDRFKNINDTHGHGVGDLVLREVAARIRTAVRTVDIVARYGGDEFVILMPETGLEDAIQVAKRIRLAVAKSPIKNKKVAFPLTLSLGVAEIDQYAKNLDELIKRADQAMYAAKAAGRNRVEAHRVEEESGHGQ